MDAKRFAQVAIASASVLLLVVLTAPLIGSASMRLANVWNGISPDREIFFDARLPRVLMAAVAGAGLATAGVLFQALLRDALATPYTLGVSSGAALGAVVAITFGFTSIVGVPAVWLFAFIGAAATLALVVAIAAEAGRISSFTLLLTGVTINAICIAAILFLQSSTTFGRSLTIMRWLMGGLETESYGTIAFLAAIVVPVCVAVIWRAREWNLMAVGQQWATTRGVNTRAAMLRGFIAGSIITGSITAFTGPIGFVGLIVPHALRLRLGADHRLLLVASAFLGGAFLVICDTAARIILAPAEVPVGVITAMLGGPFFIWLLRSRRRSLWQ